MKGPVKNRYDFVYLYDVKDGNPNGDPDAGNAPRVDPETGHGLITDVCLKRKVRNFVEIAKGSNPPYEIYVKEKAILNHQHARAYEALGVDLSKDDKKRKGGDKVKEARAWMCQNFYDVRTFGAVMATETNAGVVKGPVQLTFSRSIGPVVDLEHSITRMAVTTEREATEQGGDNRTMGRKHTIPYGLYRCHGFLSAFYAIDTQFSEGDLDLFWQALQMMFDHDRSAARGQMSFRALYAFKHISKDANESMLGVQPAHILLDRVHVKQKDSTRPARTFEDYEITLDGTPNPGGFKIIEVAGK